MRRVVGCMTGTSIDALDAALVEIDGHGLAIKARFVRGRSVALGGFAPRLRALAEQKPMSAGDIADLSHDFGFLHADAIRGLLDGERCDLVCVHGQTVFHRPPASWQLVQPGPIARALGVPVVYDLRQADLAAGGQGAPITPLADWVLFRQAGVSPTIINLGGFANYTRCAPEPSDIRGGDICVCNQLLDALARRRLDRPYDDGGEAAASGTVDRAAFKDLAMLLATQSRQGRSLGTGDELGAWIARCDALPVNVALRTACDAVAAAIVIGAGTDAPLVLGGGGVRNRTLVDLIRSSAHAVRLTSEFGVPIDHRESACFAVLGALCQDRVPITIPAITLCREPAPLSGAWVYP